MISEKTVFDIRRAYYEEGLNYSELGKRFHLNYRTIKRALNVGMKKSELPVLHLDLTTKT